jgi:hypothetical protein
VTRQPYPGISQEVMMSVTLPVWDPAALAAALRERGLPGQRSKTAIARLRRERRARKPAAGRLLTPQDRLHARLVSLYGGEISRRGGETGIQVSPKTWHPLRVTDRSGGLCVLHAGGWRYSSGRSWHAVLSYLCGGGDEGGPWAVRVPGIITTVTAALDAITPAAARHAAAAGKAVLRQGDLYALETTAAHDTPTGWVGGGWGRDPVTWARILVPAHYWDAETRILTWRPADGQEGRPLQIPWPVRFVRSMQPAGGPLRPAAGSAWPGVRGCRLNLHRDGTFTCNGQPVH